MPPLLNKIWAKSPAPKPANSGQASDKGPRGTKRKSKGDPYDEIDDDDEPPRPPPTPRNRPRIASETPASSSKGRSSPANKTANTPRKHRSRSWGTRRGNAANDTAGNPARAQGRNTPTNPANAEAEYSGSSFAPILDTDDANPSRNEQATSNGAGADTGDTAAAKPGAASEAPMNAGAKEDKAGASRKGGADKSKAQAQAEVSGDDVEVDGGEELEVRALLRHRMAEDGSGRVELLVHWAGEGEESATWETEEEIQEGAAETLYAYWKAQGGRINALFIKPKNPPVETYHVFRLLSHAKKARGGFEFEVQWVGHPPTRGETSKEMEAKLRNVAPGALDAYWESVGGRDKFLARRGRNQRGRAE
ncbi:hypothetical protein GGS23DRAFT_437894 [Durotheca rogersii]|uniref:uncharacterized protein n=1 Tax=Durotheca rogersii TaxID=419775 RepID=UPI0022205508|nr:uncharacterized protein GGS23DRAFT_437894 [Durotheca rogersii]KAI5856147.1 hypothetical protein GGS23DRAFT_437894 [Durotheca rogersii]